METLPHDMLVRTLFMAATDIVCLPAMMDVCRKWKDILESDATVAAKSHLMRRKDVDGAAEKGFLDVINAIGLDLIRLPDLSTRAARFGHVHVVSDFVSRGLISGTYSDWALWYAACEGAVETDQVHVLRASQQYFRKKGVDQMRKLWSYFAPMALKHGSADAFRYCMSFADPPGLLLSYEWYDALMAHRELALSLVSDCLVDWDETLHHALRRHQYDTIRIALANGAHVPDTMSRMMQEALDEATRPLKRQRTGN